MAKMRKTNLTETFTPRDRVMKKWKKTVKKVELYERLIITKNRKKQM